MRWSAAATALLALVAACLPAAGRAATTELLPGVTYQRSSRSTAHGPLVVHVVTAPRPGGLYSLEPVLSNDAVVGRETVSAMQRRLSGQATMVGVNGDLFELATGRPSGMLLQDGALVHAPWNGRSSVGVTTDGTLTVQRLAFFGTWQGLGTKHVLHDLNQPPDKDHAALFTSTWGGATPAVRDAWAVTLFPMPWVTPNVDLIAPVGEARRTSAPVDIPPGGAVLVARGAAARDLEAEAQVGTQVAVSLALQPKWPSVANAFGGGPVLVRDGSPVFRAGEQFLSSQLSPRNPRTAIGQRKDGRLLLVVVDGRRRGYSVGVTNWELAKLMRSLGAVNAAALDAGGSSTLAFDGTVLNVPSDPRGERAVSEGVMVAYTGVFVEGGPTAPAQRALAAGAPPVPTAFRYKVVRPSLVTTTLTAPDGTTAATDSAEREPGVYTVPLAQAGAAADTTATGATAAPAPVPAAQPPAPASGTWTLSVAATDDLGETSRMSRALVVNRTLLELRVAPARLPAQGGDVSISWTQTEAARVTVTLLGPRGAPLRPLAAGSYAPGEPEVRWNGLDRSGRPLRPGVYSIRVVATNRFGTLALLQRVRVDAAP